MNILIIAATKQEISLFQTEKSEEIHFYNSQEVETLISGPGILATAFYRDWETDRKSTRLNSSHRSLARMPSSA